MGVVVSSFGSWAVGGEGERPSKVTVVALDEVMACEGGAGGCEDLGGLAG